jgi:5-methylcytosine-specific restriction endonuclease McrA
VRCACQTRRDREHDARRPSAVARGYGSKWREARAGFLAKHPTCCRCGKPATVVHHTTPHRGDRALFWNRALWAPVCQPCHDGPCQAEEKRP